MNPEFSNKICNRKIYNEHLKWCGHMNSESDIRHAHLLNATIQKKVMILDQVESNEKIRKEVTENY